MGDPHEPPGLLLGFALLAKHFEETRIPDVLPRFLPDDWKGALVHFARTVLRGAERRLSRGIPAGSLLMRGQKSFPLASGEMEDSFR